MYILNNIKLLFSIINMITYNLDDYDNIYKFFNCNRQNDNNLKQLLQIIENNIDKYLKNSELSITNLNINNNFSHINNIKNYLNMITEVTFQNFIGKILDEINLFLKKDNQKNEIDIFLNEVFSVMSKNITYNKLNTKIYCILIENFNIFKLFLLEKFICLKDDVINIKIIDSEKNYNHYCDNNKINDERKSIFLFVTTINNILIKDFEKFKELYIYLIEYIKVNILERDNKYLNQELIELLYIIIYNSFDICKENNFIDDIISNINFFITIKTKDYPGLSNKAIFKIMDLNEYIEKLV